MADKPKQGPPFAYGIKIDLDQTQREQLHDLAKDPDREVKAADEIHAALHQFTATVLGVLNKHGVKGIQDNQVTSTEMSLKIQPHH